jgi:membrane-associated phospholipid phosphatase
MVTAFLLAGLFFVLNYRRLAVEVILGTLTLWLLVETIKALTDRARPFLDLEETRVIGWRERGQSFPSGHTAQTFFLMSVLSHRFQLGMGGNRRSVRSRRAGWFHPDVCWRTLSARRHRRRSARFRLGDSGDARGSLLVRVVLTMAGRVIGMDRNIRF